MTQIFRAISAPVLIVLSLLVVQVNAQQLELQSNNPGFWNPEEARNWRSNSGQSLAEAGSLELTGADSGAYQIVPIFRNSNHHLLSIKAVHQSLDGSTDGYAGFGINYYDVNFNFLRREEKKIPVTVSSPVVQPPDFDDVRPTTLGARIPAGARFAVIWVWNVGANDVTYADNFGIYNYFQFGQFSYDVRRPVGLRYRAAESEFRNLLFNGTTDFRGIADLAGQDFYPDRPYGADELFPEFSGDDFWRVLNPFNDSVRPFQPTGSVRVGNYSEAAVMWQQINVQPGERYSFRTLVDNIPVFGGFNSVQNHYGTIGIDFFDSSWNEITDVRLDANGPRLTDFVVPEETRFATVWVWTPPARSGQYTDLDLREIEIKKFEDADFAPKVRLLSQPPAITSVPTGPVGIAIFGQAGSPVSFPQFGAGGDVTVTGPAGSFGISYITGGPRGDGLWELIYADWNFPDNVPVNGMYEIRVSPGFVTDGQSESPETVVGYLEVAIPGR
ncbi:MAG: hypothetical protein AAF456_00625 [Planctomycetota bacterium]